MRAVFIVCPLAAALVLATGPEPPQEFTLTYDFKTRKQLEDFAGNLKLSRLIGPGLLRVAGGESLTHKLACRSITVSTRYTVENIGAPFAGGPDKPVISVSGSGNVSPGFGWTNSNGAVLNLYNLKQTRPEYATRQLGDRLKGLPLNEVPVTFSAGPERVAVQHVNGELATRQAGLQEAGKLVLHGGHGGNRFRGLVLKVVPVNPDDLATLAVKAAALKKAVKVFSGSAKDGKK